jgi:hypothetical protein
MKAAIAAAPDHDAWELAAVQELVNRGSGDATQDEPGFFDAVQFAAIHFAAPQRRTAVYSRLAVFVLAPSLGPR